MKSPLLATLAGRFGAKSASAAGVTGRFTFWGMGQIEMRALRQKFDMEEASVEMLVNLILQHIYQRFFQRDRRRELKLPII